MMAKASEQHLRPIEITAFSIEQRCQCSIGMCRQEMSSKLRCIPNWLEDDKRRSTRRRNGFCNRYAITAGAAYQLTDFE